MYNDSYPNNLSRQKSENEKILNKDIRMRNMLLFQNWGMNEFLRQFRSIEYVQNVRFSINIFAFTSLFAGVKENLTFLPTVYETSYTAITQQLHLQY